MTWVQVRPSLTGDNEQLSKCITEVAGERRYLTTCDGFSPQQVAGYRALVLQRGGVQWVAESHPLFDRCHDGIDGGVDGDRVDREEVDSGHVVGWCDVLPLVKSSTSPIGQLGMGLLPRWRGQGWGRRLLNAAVSAAFEGQIKKIELEVFVNNDAAIRLYESAGFGIDGRGRRTVSLGDRRIDLLRMSLLRSEWYQLPRRELQPQPLG